MVQYFNPINNSDFFRLTSATLTNIPFEVFTPTIVDDGGDDGGGDDGGSGGTTGTFTFSRDGENQEWENLTSVNTGSGLLITAYEGAISTFPSLILSLPDDISPGTYAEDGDEIILRYQPSFSDFYLTTEGTVTVSAHDTEANTIQGTFSFTSTEALGTGVIEITNGSFDVNYIE
jgi:hypothetical protein